MKTETKPTFKNLNDKLLNFMQGTGIQEKSMRRGEYDGKQELKLVWKNPLKMIMKMLKNPKFKNNLHYEAKVERQDCFDFVYAIVRLSENTLFDSLHTLFFGRASPKDHPNFKFSERVFGDMHTGLWMQKAQMEIGNDKTPIGVVLYSDKTHALQGMQCYPLYSKCILILTCIIVNISFYILTRIVFQ